MTAKSYYTGLTVWQYCIGLKASLFFTEIDDICPIGIEEYSFTALKGSASNIWHPVQQEKIKFISH